MDLLTYLLPFLWSGLIALYAVPSVVELAWNKGLMDPFDQRKVHHKLTPRLGGVAIFAGTFSGVLIFASIDPFIQFFMASILILFFVGVRDDLQEFKTWKKLAIQFLVTLLLVYEGDFQLTSLKSIFGLSINSEPVLLVITVLCIVAITNAINFIDGLDGLAASISAIAALTFAGFSFQSSPSLAIVSVCLGGSLLGFLRYNIQKSTVFMGDSGSLITGFIIAVTAVNLVESRSDPGGFAIIYAVLFVPVTDFLRVTLKRIFSGRSPMSAGRDHAHHILLDSGFSISKTLAFLVIITICTSFAGILGLAFFNFDPNHLIFVLIFLSFIFSAYCEIRLKKVTL